MVNQALDDLNAGKAESADTGWVDISGTVAFSSGWSFVADGSSWGGLKARRQGNVIQLVVANVQATASTFNITVDGNIANSTICTGIPTQFRPSAGSAAALAGLSAGGMGQIYIDQNGTMALAAVAPNSTYTTTTASPASTFSGQAMYFGD
jgi:hypothetical protein